MQVGDLVEVNCGGVRKGTLGIIVNRRATQCGEKEVTVAYDVRLAGRTSSVVVCPARALEVRTAR